jgi:hypothetical protein
LRVVLTVPEDQLIEACSRIKQFCHKHYNKLTRRYSTIPVGSTMNVDFDMCTE